MAKKRKPMVKWWSINLYKSKSDEEHEAIMEVVANFYQNTEIDSVQIPGPCALHGKVYGHDKFYNSAPINTSHIVSIERVERNNGTEKPHDLMCATTKSGSKYYFYSDECSHEMARVLQEKIETGKMEHKLYVTTMVYLGPMFVC